MKSTDARYVHKLSLKVKSKLNQSNLGRITLHNYTLDLQLSSGKKIIKNNTSDLHLRTVSLEANFDPFYFLLNVADYNEHNNVDNATENEIICLEISHGYYF